MSQKVTRQIFLVRCSLQWWHHNGRSSVGKFFVEAFNYLTLYFTTLGFLVMLIDFLFAYSTNSQQWCDDVCGVLLFPTICQSRLSDCLRTKAVYISEIIFQCFQDKLSCQHYCWHITVIWILRCCKRAVALDVRTKWNRNKSPMVELIHPKRSADAISYWK